MLLDTARPDDLIMPILIYLHCDLPHTKFLKNNHVLPCRNCRIKYPTISQYFNKFHCVEFKIARQVSVMDVQSCAQAARFGRLPADLGYVRGTLYFKNNLLDDIVRKS